MENKILLKRLFFLVRPESLFFDQAGIPKTLARSVEPPSIATVFGPSSTGTQIFLFCQSRGPLTAGKLSHITQR